MCHLSVTFELWNLVRSQERNENGHERHGILLFTLLVVVLYGNQVPRAVPLQV